MKKTFSVRGYPSNTEVWVDEGRYSIPCDGSIEVYVGHKKYTSGRELASRLMSMNNQSISRVINRLMSQGSVSYIGA